MDSPPRPPPSALSGRCIFRRAGVTVAARTRDGDFWMGTSDAGLARLHAGQVATITKGLPDPKINCLLPVADHEFWIGTYHGLVRWDRTGITTAGIPGSLAHAPVRAMIADRDGTVWAGGNQNRDIAEHLFISEETVKVHVRHIMEKLGASDRTQAIAIAIRRGIVEL